MTACIVVFGREPVPGKVKTRLAHDIGAERAAAVYRTLLEWTLTEARATGLPVVFSFAQRPGGFWAIPEGLRCEVQGDGDLGQRMAGAFSRRFDEGAGRVVLIGSDCPGANRHRLRDAVEQLGRAPVVLGPAEDGGYWTIGQRAPGCDCFTGVPWSSPDTLEATRQRLRSEDVPWLELDTLADVDDAKSLRHADLPLPEDRPGR